MPITTRTFRVFVSSTFEDLKEERDALQREVFPRLAALCERHGAQFEAIDLRRGVRQEAALDQKTLLICMTEIMRSKMTGLKPNFLVLLGERYGWRPLPARICADEFAIVRDAIVDPTDRKLVESWYLRDDNAAPPEYLLKARVGDFVSPLNWARVERQLHNALRMAAETSSLTASERVKYEASATHQEILKGLGETQADFDNTFAFFRSTDAAVRDSDIEALKSTLRGRLGANVYDFAAGDLSKFCADVENRLETAIRREIQKLVSMPAFEAEAKIHREFGRSRIALFVGREKQLRLAMPAAPDSQFGRGIRFLRTANSALRFRHRGFWGGFGQFLFDFTRRIDLALSDPKIIVVHGTSGSGKTAFMAKAAEQAVAAHPHVAIIQRFIGATPESTDLSTLLKGVRSEIDLSRRDSPYSMLFIDGLDQLGQMNHPDVDWLNAQGNYRCACIVVSCLPGRWVNAIKNSQPGVRFISMSANLSLAEAEVMLRRSLESSGRQLSAPQRKQLMEAVRKNRSPLYLTLLFGEVSRWRSFDHLDRRALPVTVDGVLDEMLERLSGLSEHGPVIVSRSLAYLAASRYGLTEKELFGLLSADEAVKDDYRRNAYQAVVEGTLPRIVLSRLIFELAPYLVEKRIYEVPVFTFYHRQIEEWASNILQQEPLHSSLADYFNQQPNWYDDEHNHAPNARKCIELPYHYRCIGNWERLAGTTSSYDFISAKCGAGFTRDLLTDYISCLQSDHSGGHFTIIGLIESAISPATEVLCRQPSYLPSLLYGVLLNSDSPESALLRTEIEVGVRTAWLKPISATFGRSRTTRQLTTDDANSIAFASSGTALAANCREALIVWDVISGEQIRIARHSNEFPSINCLAVNRNGAWVVWSTSFLCAVWDLESGTIARFMPPRDRQRPPLAYSMKRARHSPWHFVHDIWRHQFVEPNGVPIAALGLSENGTRLCVAYHGGPLRTWNVRTGRAGRWRWLPGPLRGKTPIGITPDGSQALILDDRKFTVVSVGDGRSLRSCTPVEPSNVKGIAFSPCGRFVALCDSEGHISVVDLDTGSEVDKWIDYWASPQPSKTRQIAISADGKYVAAGHPGVRVWKVEPGRAAEHKPHKGRVTAIAASNSAIAISGCSRGSIVVWNTATGQLQTRLCEAGANIDHIGINAQGTRVLIKRGLEVDLWDLRSGQQLLTKHCPCMDAAISSDGRFGIVLSREKGGRVCIFDVDSGLDLDYAEAPGETRVFVLDDGETFATAGPTGLTFRRLPDCHERGRQAIPGEVAFLTRNGHHGISRQRTYYSTHYLCFEVLNDGTLREVGTWENRAIKTAKITDDGRMATAISTSGELTVLRCNSGVTEAAFMPFNPLSCFDTGPGRLVIAGEFTGAVHFLRIEGLT